MKHETKCDICAILLLILVVGIFISGLLWVDKCTAETDRKYQCTLKNNGSVSTEVKEDQPSYYYVYFRDPIRCVRSSGIKRIFKVKTDSFSYEGNNMIVFTPLDPSTRRIIGHVVRVPIYNILCISWSENELMGHTY